MRTSCLSALCLAALVAACARSGEKTADSSTGAVDTTRAASNPTLADFAGTWKGLSRPAEGKDTTATEQTINAKSDTTGWTMIVGGHTVPLHVQMSGDSVMTVSEPFPSVRRKGVTVTSTTTYHLEEGKLIGHTVAHYKVKTADSVLVLHSEATKTP
ncbi:MAG TPA: hypothetical protein VHM30_09975 [Gemmatimonadaceae bacterium]|nr:hypothetical protein [Gemmatimonadaceae bacterium]